MTKGKNRRKTVRAKPLESIELLERLVAINLYANGASQEEIAKNLRVSKGKANQYVKGIKRSQPQQQVSVPKKKQKKSRNQNA